MNRFLQYTLCLALSLMAVNIANADTLCPNPEQALQSNVADLASVQADVERYKLCVQRATLLKQLNQLIVQQDSILDARKSKVRQDSFGSEFLPQIQPLGAITPETIKKVTPEEMGLVTEQSAQTAAMPEPVGYRNWFVTRIWGQSGILSAQLKDRSGRILTVQEGSSLPSGETVTKVSGDGVTVEIPDGSEKELIWDDGTL